MRTINLNSNQSNLRRSVVDLAVKVSALRQLALEIGVAEAVDMLVAMDERTPRERAATARQSLRAAVLAEYERITKLGHTRDAVSKTVAKFTSKDDLVERANLIRNLHRWLAGKIK